MADHDQTTLLTYEELAEARSISKKGAQTLTRRRRWARRKGNDGRMRVEVPVEELADHQTVPQVGHHEDHQTVPHAPVVENLRAELAEARIALARVEATLEGEQRRTADLETDRDRFADLAAQLTDTVRAMERSRGRSLFARLFA